MLPPTASGVPPAAGKRRESSRHGTIGGRGIPRQGSIPASAGQARRDDRSRYGGGVHPRERGGSVGEGQSVQRVAGPSPRARGKLDHATLEIPDAGSIPASAGEASAADSRTGHRRVHPRERGGSLSRKSTITEKSGPSPRARGKLIRQRDRAVLVRSIPASAGEAPTSRSAAPTRRVHPRERGGSKIRQKGEAA